MVIMVGMVDIQHESAFRDSRKRIPVDRQIIIIPGEGPGEGSIMDNTIELFFAFFTDFWNLIKKYATHPYTDQEWVKLIEDADEVYNKHKGDDNSPESWFFKRLVVDWLGYINQREKRRINSVKP